VTVIAVILLFLFMLAFAAIFFATLSSSKPDMRRGPDGPDAIQNAISRYDRRVRYNWYLRFWDR
jgi:hypothetical protein